MLAQDALNDARGRGLAVGAGDVDDPVISLRVSHQTDKPGSWFKPWANVLLGLPGVKLGKNLIEIVLRGHFFDNSISIKPASPIESSPETSAATTSNSTARVSLAMNSA